MAALKPWYKVVTPREDLRDGKPLDASEFAVHLDQIMDGRAQADYQDPKRFFERTYLTKNLTELAAEVVRRLSGITVESSPIFNMTTQFGGGKTHALALLYHLAHHGPKANAWPGVNRLLEKSGVEKVPKAAIGVFVGTEFDSLTGRGGDDGTPLRKTPWGEIAWQLGGPDGFALVAEHEEKMVAPAGDVIRKMLPKGKPCLILLDELMNYVSRNRKSGLSAQLYDFLQNLSETARGEQNVVLAVSIPASELEMNAEDQADYSRFKKLLDRIGKPVIMAAESETSEIIRRRLFEWGGIPDEGRKTVSEYAEWMVDHRAQIPTWFPVDTAQDAFAATYPFHPTVLSVFERKWQALPRFQQTRGILRLLAHWVSRTYQDGFKGAHKDPLITLGTAPMDDSLFRAALFEQLGESKLEAAVTTDITGKKESFAVRMDKEAGEDIKKARLHLKTATAIFFESNGGQSQDTATLPEIRLAVGEPDTDLGNVDTVLETLSASCFFMTGEGNKYKFSFKPNLNRLLADRRANIKGKDIEQRVRQEVQKIFAAGGKVERVYFPEKSSQISDRPSLTMIVAPPDWAIADDRKQVLQRIEAFTKEYGSSSRTFKSALIWCVAESAAPLHDEARKVLAWEAIEDEAEELKLDETQVKQLAENLKKAHRDLRESVWRTYKNVVLLGKDNALKVIDLGLIHSSAADSLVTLVMNRLKQDGDVEEGVSPQFLIRNWPPAFREWSTKSVRDTFFASPLFPRLSNPDAIRETIARGVSNNQLGYVGKAGTEYKPFIYGQGLVSTEVEISDDVFLVTRETAEEYRKLTEMPVVPPAQPAPGAVGATQAPPSVSPKGPQPPLPGTAATKEKSVTDLRWSGEVPSQKWMNFYTKVLSRFATGTGLKITVSVEVAPKEGLSSQKVEETKVALRELGLDDTMNTRPSQ
jgi:hypothetical protein